MLLYLMVIPMISPSATSPALTDADDNGLFFRTAPSDARGGQVLADITKEKGVKSVAITYVNTDYGVGLADVYEAAAKARGIEVNCKTLMKRIKLIIVQRLVFFHLRVVML